jgi:hypothetical protein
MRVNWLTLASLGIILGLAPVGASSGQSMADRDIETAFRGITMDGIYNDGTFFSETYFEDGTIRYHDAYGADSGDWSVREGMFCTFYESQQGACFFVERDGENCFTFFEPVKGPDGNTIKREQWTSRGWNRSEEATCTRPPEAVI